MSRGSEVGLQERVCDSHSLTVTVCHYPPGASKWNPVEHRVNCEISRNWQAVPLDSYETILKHLRRTTTTTGLRLRARLTRKNYTKGIKIPDERMAQLSIRTHTPRARWNYSFSPKCTGVNEGRSYFQPAPKVEECDPFLVPVARHARADHVAGQRAQRREEGGGPMSLIVVRHRPGPPLLDRQPRLGAVKGLDLALLIDGEDERLGRRVEVETDNLIELHCDVGVVADLEGSDQVRLQAVALPDALDARRADAELRGQGPRAPMRRGAWRLLCRLADDGGLDRAVLHRRRAPPPPCVFLNPGRPVLRKPAPPQAHGLLLDAKLDGDGLIQPPVGGS